MNPRISIIVFCAFVLSVCASYLVYRATGSRLPPGQPHTATIVIAARNLEAGALIHEGDLKLAAWPGPLPGGAISKPATALNRGVVSPIYEGEPVTGNRLSPAGSGGGLAATIPSGMRACAICAIKVNDVVGLAGFVVSGMRVDVLITGQPPGGNNLDGPKVRTLLQNIQVLSAGTNYQKDKEGKPEAAQVVNLLVTPSQAEILSLASNETHIQLVLRNPVDTGISTPPGTVLSDLFGDSHSPAALPSATPRDQKIAAQPAPFVTRASRPTEIFPPHAPQPASPRPYVIGVLNGSVNTETRFARPPEDQ